jgi:hypothetical protein
MSIKAIIKDAGPPLARAAPDVTKRPVPRKRQEVSDGAGHVTSMIPKLTNRAPNGNHLHVARFELLGKAGVGCPLCGALVVESFSSMHRRGAGHVRIRIPLETIDEPSVPWLLLSIHMQTSIVVRTVRTSKVLTVAVVGGTLLGVIFVSRSRHGCRIRKKTLQWAL